MWGRKFVQEKDRRTNIFATSFVWWQLKTQPFFNFWYARKKLTKFWPSENWKETFIIQIDRWDRNKRLRLRRCTFCVSFLVYKFLIKNFGEVLFYRWYNINNQYMWPWGGVVHSRKRLQAFVFLYVSSHFFLQLTE